MFHDGYRTWDWNPWHVLDVAPVVRVAAWRATFMERYDARTDSPEVWRASASREFHEFATVAPFVTRNRWPELHQLREEMATYVITHGSRVWQRLLRFAGAEPGNSPRQARAFLAAGLSEDELRIGCPLSVAAFAFPERVPGLLAAGVGRPTGALFWATRINAAETARLLLEAGGEVDHCWVESIDRGRPGWRGSALCVASEMNAVDVARLLVQAGANVEILCNGRRPLGMAAGAGSLEMVEFLLEQGANPNAEGTRGTPLQCASERKKIACARRLVEAGADVYESSLESWSPFAMICAGIRTEYCVGLVADAIAVAELMITRGGNPNVSQGFGTPTIFAAIASRAPSVVECLVRAGVDLSQTWRPSSHAAQYFSLRNRTWETPVTAVQFARVEHLREIATLLQSASGQAH